MYLLILGLLMWSGIHLFPAITSSVRTKIINKLGFGIYKGLFAILIVFSIVIIVFGWRSMESSDVYIPPAWGRYLTLLLVLLTFILFIAANTHNNIKQILRHPQLTGLVLWGIGHLFANGDKRSLLLFTWLTVWALLEMFMINRREGTWKKPEYAPVKNDIITIISGCLLYTVLLFAHPYLSGISIV